MDPLVPERQRPETPRWVKALAVGAAVVVLVVVLVMLIVGGEHGPGRHSDSPATIERSIQGPAAAGASVMLAARAAARP